MDKHQSIILKQIQGLPQQAANVAAKVLVGLGVRSIQYGMMESRINIFCKIASMDPEFIETRLLHSVLTSTTRCKRWCFTDVRCNLEELYLPSVDYIILHPVKSTVWKKIAKMAVMHLENDSNQTDIHQKSTLSMLLGYNNANTETKQTGQPIPKVCYYHQGKNATCSRSIPCIKNQVETN